MYWHNIVLTILIIFNIAYGDTGESDDELIVRGILYDEYQAYENSYEVYRELYNRTKAEIYLFKEVSSSLMISKYIKSSIIRLNKWRRTHSHNLEARRLIISLYTINQDIIQAKKESILLIKQSSHLIDLELASNSFLYSMEYEKSLELLDRIYHRLPREEILMRMVEIMEKFTNQTEEAIQLIESHRRMNIVNQDVYIKLLNLYQKQRDVDGIMDIYKVLYSNDNNEEYLDKIIQVYMYQNDIDGAISFLENNHIKRPILYELYKGKKYFTKALYLLDILYNKDGNPKWLAEKAIMIFESAKDKNSENVIKNIIVLFEKAIELGNDDSIYLNYYGYTLIEKDIDVPKGIDMIQQALIQQPDNTFYLDSLAWGYYKQKKCKKAYNTMEIVVEEEGLKNSEVREHWRYIKECKKRY